MEDKDVLTKRLREDLIGPLKEDEVLDGYPTDVYLSGILYPQKEDISQDQSERLQAEGGGATEPGDTAQDEVPLSTIKRPASAGISFSVTSDKKNEITIDISAARYEKIPVKTREGCAEGKNQWRRVALSSKLERVALTDKSMDLGSDKTGIDGLALHVRTTKLEQNKMLVTVAMINENQNPTEYERELSEARCFFQTGLKITCCMGTDFCERPLAATAMDSDTRTNALIYRHVKEFATGHTCSAGWQEHEGTSSTVFTNWLPTQNVKAMSAEGVHEFRELSEQNVLSTDWLAASKGAELIDGLSLLPKLYESWLQTLQQDADVLEGQLKQQAEEHLNKAHDIAKRIEGSISSIQSDEDVQLAFRLANQAIKMQRSWSNPSEEKPLKWRPFQLGFILLTLDSLASGIHPDRNVADLLWFPTGGGKTEAYLGLVAFTLFLRRLKWGDNGAGVACFMRYTLRLLTVQQFQRATTLICACEAIRTKFNNRHSSKSLGEEQFSIGLWVGGDTTPNSHKQACDTVKDPTADSSPVQLKYCPMHQSSKLIWSLQGANGRVEARCSETDCLWHNQALPVWTVDEYIYELLPSLVIGTVDKFAQITRKKSTGKLFGQNTPYRQPDLIIQDELHLISGPLGTMTGLYEIAIDKLCTNGDVRPKIVASTATIRQAHAQIRALFDRTTCLFPSPGLDSRNSGFAVEDFEDSGRLYLGVTTAGRSAKFTLQAVCASLLQSASSPQISDATRDDFWTQVTYFNSLRELGGALVLMQDDVIASVRDYASRRGEEPRAIKEIMELTSRVSSSQIKEFLNQLEQPFGSDNVCDAVLASNMISVGVDVSRLGVMIVNGQPKGIAEYIQATSRVGRRRGGPGGLVVGLFNNAKARDRSHFETFRTWHMGLYRDVEATSVTPFAPRARDKALHATLVILARHLIPELNEKPLAVEENQELLTEFIDDIVNRAERIDEEEADNVRNQLELFLERWEAYALSLKQYWQDYNYKNSLLISAEKAAEIKARRGLYDGRAAPTPNSMRNVEASSLFILEEKLRRD